MEGPTVLWVAILINGAYGVGGQSVSQQIDEIRMNYKKAMKNR
ncbi:MAG: hypothetical protein P8184_19065 [Calditrichia bacterium]